MHDTASRRGIKLHYLCENGIQNWLEEIELFEKKFSFRFDGQHLSRSHLGCYHRFYAGWERSRFVIGSTPRDEVACLLTLVKKNVLIKGKLRSGVYICDFKIAPDYALWGLREKLLMKMLLRLPLETFRWRCSFTFFASAIKPRVSLVDSVRKHLIGTFARSVGIYELYSVSRRTIEDLMQAEPPQEAFCRSTLLNLNHHTPQNQAPDAEAFRVTWDTRQFLFKADQSQFKVAHVQTDEEYGAGFLQRLLVAARSAPDDTDAFWFGIDSRRKGLKDFFARHGIVPAQLFHLSVGTALWHRFEAPLFVLNSSEL